MEVIDNIKEAVRLLREVEDYNNQLNGEDGFISVCDKKIDYWMHYLELEDLKLTEAYNIVREIKKQRLLRRRYKDDAELIKIYKDNESKMQNPNTRDFLLMQIYKTDSRHKNAKYNYSAYTEEERDSILRPKRKE